MIQINLSINIDERLYRVLGRRLIDAIISGTQSWGKRLTSILNKNRPYRVKTAPKVGKHGRPQRFRFRYQLERRGFTIYVDPPERSIAVLAMEFGRKRPIRPIVGRALRLVKKEETPEGIKTKEVLVSIVRKPPSSYPKIVSRSIREATPSFRRIITRRINKLMREV